MTGPHQPLKRSGRREQAAGRNRAEHRSPLGVTEVRRTEASASGR